MKIADITLKNNLIFAPLAGFSTPPVRRLMAQNGAGLTVTEMVSVKGLLFGSEKTAQLLLCAAEEAVKCVQLFGSDPDEFYRVVSHPALLDFDIIDINMGCPVRKIVSNGEGSALISTPKLAAEIVKAAAAGIREADSGREFKRAVTVKTRLGVSAPTEILEFAPVIEEAGAAMLTLHGRTAKQMYTGAADYSAVKAVKKLLKIPLCANGDVVDLDSYKRIRDTGCDAVMLGRGALIDPSIFLKLAAADGAAAGENCAAAGADSVAAAGGLDKKTLFMRLIDYMEKFYGAEDACIALRKFLPYILKGVRGGKELRQRMNFSTDLKVVRKGIASCII